MEEKRCHETAVTLDLLKEVILDHWERLARTCIPKATHAEDLLLKDHLPEILDQLIHILNKQQLGDVELGKLHGFQRFDTTNFTVQDLMDEYSLFRETLIDYLYPMGAIDCSKLVHKFIDIILKNAIAEFLEDLPAASRVEKKHYGSELKELESNPVITGGAHH